MPQQFLVLKIKDTKAQIERKIKDALKKRFADGRVLQSAGFKVSIKVKNLFLRRMHESVTYRELSSHSFLVGELGLEDPQGKIDIIIDQWVDSLKLTFKLVRGGGLGIKGGFTIQMVRSNYAEVLKLPQAKQRATSKRPKSSQKLMRWLEWLLIRGDEKIVIGYDVHFRPGAGRTGLAIMFESKQGFRSWSVPLGFTGTKNNNFVTEVLEIMVLDIMRIMIEEIARAARRA